MQLYIITKCESIVTGSSAVTTAADYNHHILTKTDHTKCNNSCVEMPSQTLIYNELLLSITFAGRVGFEKLTELDYRGTTYYTIRNLSLYECQGWCREEPDCAAASFRFVVFSGWHSRKWQTITQNKATSHRDEVYSSTHLFFFFCTQFCGQPAGAHPGDGVFVAKRDDRGQSHSQPAKVRLHLLHDQAQHQIR